MMLPFGIPITHGELALYIMAGAQVVHVVSGFVRRRRLSKTINNISKGQRNG